MAVQYSSSNKKTNSKKWHASTERCEMEKEVENTNEQNKEKIKEENKEKPSKKFKKNGKRGKK